MAERRCASCHPSLPRRPRGLAQPLQWSPETNPPPLRHASRPPPARPAPRRRRCRVSLDRRAARAPPTTQRRYCRPPRMTRCRAAAPGSRRARRQQQQARLFAALAPQRSRELRRDLRRRQAPAPLPALRSAPLRAPEGPALEGLGSALRFHHSHTASCKVGLTARAHDERRHEAARAGALTMHECRAVHSAQPPWRDGRARLSDRYSMDARRRFARVASHVMASRGNGSRVGAGLQRRSDALLIPTQNRLQEQGRYSPPRRCCNAASRGPLR